MIENSKEESSKPDPNAKKIISVGLNQLNWPSEINEQFPVEILQWLISDDLSATALEVAANARIHVIKKPKTKKDVYLIVGGFLSFLLLLRFRCTDEIECILDNTIDAHDLPKIFYQDVCYDTYLLKAGPLATAAKAAVFIKLLEMGERIGAPSNFKLSSRHICNNKGLLKLVVGFDPRSYQRCDKSVASDSVLLTIEDVLGISRK